MKKLLPKNLCVLADAAADDATRYAMQGVRVRLKEKGYIAEATDGRILFRVEGEYPDGLNNFPDVAPYLNNPPTDEDEVIIPAKSLAAIGKVKLCRAARPEIQDCFVLTTGQYDLALTVTDIERAVTERTRRMEEGKFPDTDAVLKVKAKPAFGVINFNPKLIDHALKILTKLIETADTRAAKNRETPRVEFVFCGKNNPLLIKARTAMGQQVTALIVPVT